LIRRAEFIRDLSAIEVDPQRLRLIIDGQSSADVAIENMLLIVVHRLQQFVADAKSPTVAIDLGNGFTRSGGSRIQYFLKSGVEGSRAKRRAIHRSQDLNIAKGIQPESRWDALANKRDDALDDRWRR